MPKLGTLEFMMLPTRPIGCIQPIVWIKDCRFYAIKLEIFIVNLIFINKNISFIQTKYNPTHLPALRGLELTQKENEDIGRNWGFHACAVIRP